MYVCMCLLMCAYMQASNYNLLISQAGPFSRPTVNTPPGGGVLFSPAARWEPGQLNSSLKPTAHPRLASPYTKATVITRANNAQNTFFLRKSQNCRHSSKKTQHTKILIGAFIRNLSFFRKKAKLRKFFWCLHMLWRCFVKWKSWSILKKFELDSSHILAGLPFERI